MSARHAGNLLSSSRNHSAGLGTCSRPATDMLVAEASRAGPSASLDKSAKNGAVALSLMYSS